MAGSIVGLVVGGYLTRDWDLPPAPEPRFALIPTSTGGVTPGLAFAL